MSKEQSQPVDENKLIAERRSKLAAIREKGQAFPNEFRREDFANKLQEEFSEQSKEELETLGHQTSVAGRIMAKRGPFMVLQDVSGSIQLYADKTQVPLGLPCYDFTPVMKHKVVTVLPERLN